MTIAVAIVVFVLLVLFVLIAIWGESNLSKPRDLKYIGCGTKGVIRHVFAYKDNAVHETIHNTVYLLIEIEDNKQVFGLYKIRSDVLFGLLWSSDISQCINRRYSFYVEDDSVTMREIPLSVKQN